MVPNILTRHGRWTAVSVDGLLFLECMGGQLRTGAQRQIGDIRRKHELHLARSWELWFIIFECKGDEHRDRLIQNSFPSIPDITKET